MVFDQPDMVCLEMIDEGSDRVPLICKTEYSIHPRLTTGQLHLGYSPKCSVHNAHYVQLPISHGKTATPSGCGRLYRVLGRFDTQDRAFIA